MWSYRTNTIVTKVTRGPINKRHTNAKQKETRATAERQTRTKSKTQGAKR